ncbi:MAG: universal stress protein [Deltaproteobacteria bacterium]|nr:universal stress protein [Deltaproteobacteria bacterium]
MKKAIRNYIEVCYGVPFKEITRLIRERDVQLVVMGTQGRGFFGEFFLGSVSHNVLRQSVAPVLLIPAPRETGTRKTHLLKDAQNVIYFTDGKGPTSRSSMGSRLKLTAHL